MTIRTVLKSLRIDISRAKIFGLNRSNVEANSLTSLITNLESGLVATIKIAEADFVHTLPDGLNTMVSEGGTSLSGGQRQRLAIARAVLRDPAILILDEATSQIDSESEAEIGRTMQAFGKDRTVLVVAHRPATILAADEVVVMDQGRIIDQGTNAELQSRCSLYRALVGQVD